MLVLGIESTCDETGVAIVDSDTRRVLSNVVASQADIHAVYRGVVPEIASRAHIENILPVLSEALRGSFSSPLGGGVRGIASRQANDSYPSPQPSPSRGEGVVSLRDIDAIAVAHRPGLIGSLLIGLTAAKTLAWSIGKPLIGVDHVQAHLYSVTLDSSVDIAFPTVGLVCSGGHTALYELKSWTDITLLGKTIDDAVGEAYDKVSATLGLGYPGGPIVDRLAQSGDPKAVDFPRSLLGRDSLDFSFSGLKTSVLYHVHGERGRLSETPRTLDEATIRNVAASFQAACVDTLIIKLKRAIERVGAKSVIIGGGVSANSGLRAALHRLPVPAFVPGLKYCTDNAAMIAGLGGVLLREGVRTSLDLDAVTSSAIR